MITAIDPVALKKSGKTVRVSSRSSDFSQFMGAMAPAAGQAHVQATGNSNEAAVTHAAMTGLSGATASYHAPYYGASGVYGTPTAGFPAMGTQGTGGVPVMGTQALPTFGPGGSQAATGFQTPTAGGAAGGASAAFAPGSSQNVQDQSQLLGQMYDSSVNMLFLQAQVQDQNRQFTMASNMLQSRDRTLQNMVQNMRGM
jgi:hypothetical protein